MNSIEARVAVGDLRKFAPRDHWITGLGSITQIKTSLPAAVSWSILDKIASNFGLPARGDALAALFDAKTLTVEKVAQLLPDEPEQIAKDYAAFRSSNKGAEVSVPEAQSPTPSAESAMAMAMRALAAAASEQEKAKDQAAGEAAVETAVRIRSEFGEAISEIGKRMSAMRNDLENRDSALHNRAIEALDEFMKKADESFVKIGKHIDVIMKELAEDKPGKSLDHNMVRGIVTESIKSLARSHKRRVDLAASAASGIPGVPSSDRNLYKPAHWDRLVGLIRGGYPIILTGPSGAGKTYLFEQVFAELKRPLKVYSCADGINVETLTSIPHIKGGDTRYDDGILTHAMRHGYGLVLDEADAIQESEALILNRAVEYREVVVQSTGETVKAKDGFWIGYTSNTLGDETGVYNRAGINVTLQNRSLSLKVRMLAPNEETTLARNLRFYNGIQLPEPDIVPLVGWFQQARQLHLGINGKAKVLVNCPSTRLLVRAAKLMCGVDDSGDRPLGFRMDMKEAIWWTYASVLVEEEVAALKSIGSWLW